MNLKTREALELIKNRYESIDDLLLDEKILTDINKLKDLNKEKSSLQQVYDKFVDFLNLEKDNNDAKLLLESEKDNEMRNFAKEQYDLSLLKMSELEKEIDILLIPKDPNDNKNVIIEIRGAAGGDEANIFAGDLFRMYQKYCERNKWKIDILDEYESEAGGFSQISFMIKGENVYSKLKFESGAHRVQRVPKTESKGRIQTSTATVVVLPEASEVDVKILPSDLRIDTYRSSGAGGQHVNTTDSAVRITHLPTGIVAASQDGRSQHDNKDIAMTMLRAKILDAEIQKREKEEGDIRKTAVGSGDRSEKIRTYNFPDNRITDHRIGLTINKLDKFLEGYIDEVVTELINNEKKEKIKNSIL